MLKLQACVVAVKGTPPLLLQAAETLSRQWLDSERQLAAASQNVERLTYDLLETRAKDQQTRAAPLHSQVPNVVELPCTAIFAGRPPCQGLPRARWYL